MSAHSDAKTIIDRYTSALFGLAEEKKKLKPLSDELAALKITLENSDDLIRFCDSPTISFNERAAALEALLKKAKSSPLMKNFMHTLVENGRLALAGEIAEEFARRIFAKNDELVAEVETAIPMKKAQQTKLQKMLKESLGKKVALEIHVNESLLGGLRVKVDGQLIDASLSGRMQRISSHLNLGIQQVV